MFILQQCSCVFIFSRFPIKIKRVSDDSEFESEFNFLGKHAPVQNPCLDRIKISTYLLCKYDDRYWIGIVSDIDEAAGDVKVKFMHPHYPGISFFWPSQKKDFWTKMTVISDALRVAMRFFIFKYLVISSLCTKSFKFVQGGYL